MNICPSDFSAIAALDLDPIKVKLMHQESGEGWSLGQVNAVETEYRRFLYIMKEFPNELAAPRFDVDIFWHYHILDTVKYAQDCEAVFGYFLHHFPYLGLRGEEDLDMHHRVGQRMRELYEETFGEPFVREAELDAAPESPAGATAFSVRAPGSVAATGTAFSVRSTASIAAAQTAFSVRAPVSADASRIAFSVRAPASTANLTAFSVRAPASTAARTAFSVRAPASAGAGKSAFSVRAPAAQAALELPSTAPMDDEPEHSLAAFYSHRPHLDMCGAPQQSH